MLSFYQTEYLNCGIARVFLNEQAYMFWFVLGLAYTVMDVGIDSNRFFLRLLAWEVLCADSTDACLTTLYLSHLPHELFTVGSRVPALRRSVL
jgi:hypothetical protein